jgi:two-component system, NarL family, invasion response regulator UvrY
MTSVLVVDAHPIVLQGCRRVLEELGVAKVLEARDASTAYRLYRRHRPDVVMVELAVQGSSLGGLALIRRIKTHNPRAQVLVLTVHSDPIIVTRALEAGATGYVLKDASLNDLMKAFGTVQSGSPYLNPELALRVALAHTPAQQSPLADLTPRELQTLSLLGEGKSYSNIAEELGVSYKTVVNVSYQLKKKLDAHSLSDLIRIAVQLLSATSAASALSASSDRE